MTNISVIIPTYNGANKITETLKALDNQDMKENFEVIVVIDGSTDDTFSLVKTFHPNKFKLNILNQENTGRSGARNNGVRIAKGELIIFYDDDARPAEDSLSRHVLFHKKNQNSLCCGFPLEDESRFTSDFQRYKRYLSEKWTSKFKNKLEQVTDDHLFLTAANFSIPKNIFNEIGGFNTSLTDAEDYELAYRSIKMGYPIYFDKENIAWHYDSMTCEKYIERQRQYANVNARLKGLVPDHLIPKELDLNKLSYPKKVIYSMVSRAYWVKIIKKNALSWLPKPIRYKIYDVVITGLGRIYTQRPIL